MQIFFFKLKTEDDIHSVTLGGSFAYDKYDESFDGIEF